MPKLTVQNAEIKTATVEVRTLTLSGKQVTLSVFKQIEQGPLAGLDGTFSGQLWGRVNYHPDGCKDSPAHIHVIWQDGSDLRRSTVPHALEDQHSGVYYSEAADRYLTSAFLDLANGDTAAFADWTDPEKDPRDQWGFPASIKTPRGCYDQLLGHCKIDGLTVAGDMHQAAVNMRTGMTKGLDLQGLQGRRGTLAGVVARWSASTGELREEVDHFARRERERREWVAKLHAEVLALPQLFIAV